jgi:late competence protein required for DNA uptake (superfamily II DNA/RNA helicase)
MYNIELLPSYARPHLTPQQMLEVVIGQSRERCDRCPTLTSATTQQGSQAVDPCRDCLGIDRSEILPFPKPSSQKRFTIPDLSDNMGIGNFTDGAGL